MRTIAAGFQGAAHGAIQGASLGSILAGGLAMLTTLATPASALDSKPGEKEALHACEQRICEVVLKKEAAGGDVACEVGKTWLKSKLKEGSEKRKLSWSFGDARCGVNFTLPRDTMLSALSKPAHSLEFKPEVAKCEVEREGEVTTVSVTLQPKINFKDGKAEKIWLNVKSIEAPAVVKGALWTAAQIEDTIGLFHAELVGEINELLQDKCAKKYGGK